MTVSLCALTAAASVAAAPAASAGTALTGTAYNDCLVYLDGVDLQTATIPQLQADMSHGLFTSAQLTQAYLDRIAAYNQGGVKVNAIRAITGDALAQARAADTARAAGTTSPMLGIPVLLKDNVDTTDADTTAGSIALAGNRPAADASITAQLRQAGAVILGKTNLSEFANWMAEGMPNGFSSLGGQVVNPYNQGDPSGSSSGSGAGGTLAFAAATIGTETSGSILSPSTANSMVGIKPTVGLVSRNGIIPLAHSYDTAGPIARDVTDAATMLSAVSGTDTSDVVNDRAAGGPPANHDYTPFLQPGALAGARIGYSPNDEPTNASQKAVFDAAKNQLTAAGATLVSTTEISQRGDISLTELGGIPSEFKYGIKDYLAHDAGPAGPTGRPTLVTDDLTGVIAYNQQHSSQIPYGQSLLLASDATTGATQNDPSSTATITGARTVIDTAFSDGLLDAYAAPNAAYAGLGAAAGYPSITVPDGYTSAATGVTPQGLQLLGEAWTEPKLIGYGYAYEQRTHLRTPATVYDPAITTSTCQATAALPDSTTAVALPTAGLMTGFAAVVLRRRRRQHA